MEITRVRWYGLNKMDNGQDNDPCNGRIVKDLARRGVKNAEHLVNDRGSTFVVAVMDLNNT